MQPKMTFAQRIRNFFGGNHTLRWYSNGYGYVPELTCHKFGETIFLNIAQILTDIYAELTWTSDSPTAMWRAWSDWATRNGQRISLRLLRERGYVVVGYDSRLDVDGNPVWAFYELSDDKYTTRRVGDKEIVECKDASQLFYVLRSPSFEQVGTSDHELCKGYIALIDAVMNGATTTAERLGAFILMTPKSDNFGGVLTKDEKDDLEKEMSKGYGMLRHQKQMMLLPRPMDTATVSLAEGDKKMVEKMRQAVLAIADRLKVPANQIALIDANSSKSLSNGTELREGDMAKYRSFRRFVDATFYDMAVELGMRPNYILENEPKSVQGQQIENV